MKFKIFSDKYLSFSIRNTLISLAVLAFAITASYVFFEKLGQNVNMIFILAVILISRLTAGYFYGLLAALVSVLSVNYFFAYPFGQINFSLDGYPVTYLTMFCVAFITSALTTAMQQQTERAIVGEKKTKELFELNKKLEMEQQKILFEAEKEKMRGNLLRAISHDLRTPLTAISGATSAIYENDEKLSSVERKALLKDINSDATWLIRMVENLLSVTRINDGLTKIRKSEEAVEEIIAESVQKIKKKYPHSRIKVTVPEDLLIVPMDGMLIEQVIINLIENAIKHAHTEDDILVSVAEENGNAVFSVTDFGCGIEDEALKRIREGRYVRMDEKPDSCRDMGIGLSVCTTIIKAHGGQFIVDSELQKGSEFKFLLPIDFDEGEEIDYEEENPDC